MATEADLTEQDIEFIKELRAAREQGVVNRRQALGLLAGLGIGGVGGYTAVDKASADASTSDSDGNVGTPSDPVDVFAEGLGGPTGDVVDVGSNLDLKSSQEIQNASAITTDDGNIGGDPILGAAASSSDPGLGFDSWRTPDANNPVLVSVETQAKTDGSSNGDVQFEVDESGGTTPDYNLRNFAESDLGSGAGQITSATVILPPGASYQVRNNTDPTGNNAVLDIRELTL